MQMRNENLKIQSALKDAVDAKLAKEGEVSILRKNIEKASHLATLHLLIRNSNYKIDDSESCSPAIATKG